MRQLNLIELVALHGTLVLGLTTVKDEMTEQEIYRAQSAIDAAESAMATLPEELRSIDVFLPLLELVTEEILTQGGATMQGDLQ